ncbi:MAG: hypothetical protein MJ072_07050, partial [Clostridia bacterium]|nr:hypothetical protein [Clostridia bacterium]
RKYLCGQKGGIVKTDNEEITPFKMEFDLVIDGKRERVTTGFSGRHFLTDICLAVCCAYYLGVEKEKIFGAIAMLKPPEHRLNVFKCANGAYVVDDGYNANEDGVKSACELLSLFSGKKIAVTSGIVELGIKTKSVNEKVGENVGKVADLTIAVGVNSKYIASGVKSVNKSVIEVKTLEDTKEILKKTLKPNDVVLFLNDLPDKYNG